MSSDQLATIDGVLTPFFLRYRQANAAVTLDAAITDVCARAHTVRDRVKVVLCPYTLSLFKEKVFTCYSQTGVCISKASNYCVTACIASARASTLPLVTPAILQDAHI